MELNELFSKTRSIAIVGGIVLLLLVAIGEANDLFFVEPNEDEYITADYETDKKSYNEQKKVWDEVRKPAEQKRFKLRATTGLAFIVAGSLTPITSIGTGLVTAGVIEICYAYMNNWGSINGIIRLISVIIAIIVLCFFLYRWERRKENLK